MLPSLGVYATCGISRGVFTPKNDTKTDSFDVYISSYDTRHATLMIDHIYFHQDIKHKWSPDIY